jgi:Tol biopolymer transport system component
MPHAASGCQPRIRALAICAVSLALPLVAGCKGNPDASASGIPINTAAGWSDSPFISGDGQRLYFSYSRYDFGPWFLSGGAQPPVLSGPDRAGLHHSANPFDESDTYVAMRNLDGTWSEAINLGLNGAHADSGGMEINGGNTFVWAQGNGTASNIVMANRNPDGTWGAAADPGPAINDHAAGALQDSPKLSADGKTLWFSSNRPSGQGGRDIWFSSNSSGSWSAPANLGAPVNTAGDEDRFWFASGSSELYWNGPGGIMHCYSAGSTCSGTPDAVTIPGCSLPSWVSITDDGQRMYFACRVPETGRMKIMYSIKQDSGSWGVAHLVD